MSQNNLKSSSTTRNWRKLQRTAIYQVSITSAFYVYQKNTYLDDSAHKPLMITHTNFEMFDDSTHEFLRMIVHPRRFSVLTEYLSAICSGLNSSVRKTFASTN